MRHKTTQTLYAYWNAVRRGRIAPQRLEIQPSHIAEILADTFILERLDSHTFRFRLAGSRLRIRLDTELRSSNFLDMWSEGDRGLLEHHLAATTELGRVGVFTLEATSGSGRARTFEIIVLPLLHTGTAINRLLCSLSDLELPEGSSDERLTTIRLIAAEAVWPEGRPHALVDKLSRQSPLQPHVRNARIVRQDRRQFRVYDGGLSTEQNKKL